VIPEHIGARPPQRPPPRSLARIVRRQCAQLFVVFAGRRDTDETFGSAQFLEQSGLGGRNLILLRDPFDENFARGVGRGIDSVAALAEWLLAARQDLAHVRRVYCLGHSSGGAAALLFGHLVGADVVFAFSPRSAPEGAAEANANLARLLREHNGVTSYRIWFARDNDADRAFAARLADCPGVTLDPREGFDADHDLMARLMDRGDFAALLPSFVGDP
jgi:hypothetical protein